MPKFGHFEPKGTNILILTKYRTYPILNVLILNLSLVFENFEPKSPIGHFWVKMYQPFNLNEISHVPYFKGADFKFDIGFPKF